MSILAACGCISIGLCRSITLRMVCFRTRLTAGCASRAIGTSTPVTKAWCSGRHSTARIVRMKYRRLGKTDLRVSVIGIGTWQFGGEWGKNFTQPEIDAIFDAAREAGLNLID